MCDFMHSVNFLFENKCPKEPTEDKNIWKQLYICSKWSLACNRQRARSCPYLIRLLCCVWYARPHSALSSSRDSLRCHWNSVTVDRILLEWSQSEDCCEWFVFQIIFHPLWCAPGLRYRAALVHPFHWPTRRDHQLSPWSTAHGLCWWHTNLPHPETHRASWGHASTQRLHWRCQEMVSSKQTPTEWNENWKCSTSPHSSGIPTRYLILNYNQEVSSALKVFVI